jgi:ribosome-binding protein aMBF1 (putative translation factor)
MKTSTTDAAEILDAEFGDDPEYRAARADARNKSQAAREIYEARTAAGLTQKQLADLIGTNQSVISRLEEADYNRHSLAMLDRIARALNRRLEVRLVPTAQTGAH